MSLVAIVGRPNVGKSTLFNRLVGQRKAIVDATAGTTRDRHYGKTDWNGREFSVIDTGGYALGGEDIFEEEIRKQVVLAVEEADVILFLVEVSTGITDLDMAVADLLRRTSKKVILVVNKVDNNNLVYGSHEFYALGLGDPYCISSISGSGTGELRDAVVAALPPDTEAEQTDDLPKFAIVGRPNVGKSTLINALVGEKVSITSKKPQTTRDRIMGVLTTDNAQYLFVDTPGFQTKHSSELLARMNQSVRSSLSDVDAVVMVIEATGWRPEDQVVLNLLSKDAKNVILAINKTDEVKESEAMLPLIKESMEKFPFADVVPVSAEKTRQLDVLLEVIRKYLPEGDKLYEDDIYTDKSPRFLAAEIIREKAFSLLGDELPYGVAVIIDKWEESDDKARIFATLLVNRESHKGIVIGEKGAKLREISRLAREDISKMLGKNVYLEVWVRVRKGWGDDAQVLKSLGY